MWDQFLIWWISSLLPFFLNQEPTVNPFNMFEKLISGWKRWKGRKLIVFPFFNEKAASVPVSLFEWIHWAILCRRQRLTFLGAMFLGEKRIHGVRIRTKIDKLTFFSYLPRCCCCWCCGVGALCVSDEITPEIYVSWELWWNRNALDCDTVSSPLLWCMKQEDCQWQY